MKEISSFPLDDKALERDAKGIQLEGVINSQGIAERAIFSIAPCQALSMTSSLVSKYLPHQLRLSPIQSGQTHRS